MWGEESPLPELGRLNSEKVLFEQIFMLLSAKVSGWLWSPVTKNVPRPGMIESPLLHKQS
jgi:hypothetical protein